MRFLIKAPALAASLLLAGCGTQVPSLREWPATTDRDEGDMIASIVRSLGCELRYAVTSVVDHDRGQAPHRLTGRVYAEFLKDWGVQVALNFTIIERTGFNPTLLLTPPSSPSSIFTLSGGASVSAEATRIQKMNFFYMVSELYSPAEFRGGKGREVCRDPTGNREGSLLVDSDLRLSSLIQGRLGATMLGFASSPGTSPLLPNEKNVLSQSISFKILTSGQATPTWRLVRATVNPSGSLLSVGRDRTHELVFTFGPLDKSVRGARALTPLAQQTHLQTQLQTGIRNSLISP